MDVRETVVEKLAAQKGLDKSQIRMENTFVELGLDSLDVVELSLDLEDALGISIPHTEIVNIKTVGQAVEFAEKNKK